MGGINPRIQHRDDNIGTALRNVPPGGCGNAGQMPLTWVAWIIRQIATSCQTIGLHEFDIGMLGQGPYHRAPCSGRDAQQVHINLWKLVHQACPHCRMHGLAPFMRHTPLESDQQFIRDSRLLVGAHLGVEDSRKH